MNSAGEGRVEMPALIGTDPLGFLAALGVLRLVTTDLGWDATLSWPDGPRRGAVLGGCPGETGIDELVGVLVGVAVAAEEAEQLIPGVDGFPPSKESSQGSDPVKDLSFRERSGLATTSLARSSSFAEWLVASVSLAARDGLDARDRLTSAFVRPTGQVTFDRSLKNGLASITPTRVREALVGWVRVEGTTGNYFDQRAVRDEFVGAHTKGQMKNAGVPGAAWLALMALPWLPVRTSSTGRAVTVGFQRRRGQPTRMVWPVWTNDLRAAGVEALLDHPTFARIDVLPVDDADKKRRSFANSSALRTMGVSAVFASERRPGPQGPEGALGPSVVIASVRVRSSTARGRRGG